MTILAIDTTSQWCSVAIYLDQKNYFFKHEQLGNTASQRLLDFIADVLNQAQLKLEDISAFACSQGPGAFTGIRLGIGVSQGIAYAQKKPLIPISSLDGMVAHTWLTRPALFQNQPVTVAIDARMSQMYTGEYHQNDGTVPHCIRPIQIQDDLTQSQSDSKLLVSYQCAQYESFASAFKSVIEATPHALGIAYLASLLSGDMERYSPEYCQPLYVRDKVAQTTLERTQINLV
jgi:tRNA threonylcarbamoyladenosine biosynthesis protein TsaB